MTLSICKYSEEVLKMRRNLNADDDTKSIKIALYCVAVVDDQSDRYSEALEKLEELDRMIENTDNPYSKFLVLSLKINVKCKLHQIPEAELFEQLVTYHESQKYNNE